MMPVRVPFGLSLRSVFTGPISASSSSWQILTKWSPAETWRFLPSLSVIDVWTTSPTAFSRTRATNFFTTSKATSASSRETRMSRSDSSTISWVISVLPARRFFAARKPFVTVSSMGAVYNSGPMGSIFDYRLAALDAERDRFRAFVARHARGLDPDEVVQGALARAAERRADLEAAEDPRAWFFRVLRTTLIDQFRRSRARSQASERLSLEPQEPDVPDDAPARTCRCVHRALSELKPEYQEPLRRVDLGDERISEVAPSLGISANNATVRLHRARKALRAKVEDACGECAAAGCLDCSCAEGV